MTPLEADNLVTLIGCIGFPLAIFVGLEFACWHIKRIERAVEARYDRPYPDNDIFCFITPEEDNPSPTQKG